MPGFEPGASYMRSKRSTSELHPQLEREAICVHKLRSLSKVLLGGGGCSGQRR